MKIGIDISMLVYHGSGVARYTYNFVKSLLTFDKKNEYKLFYSSFRKPHDFYLLDDLRSRKGKIYSYLFPPTLIRFFWNKYHIFPIEWFLGDVDVFHSSDYLRPPFLRNIKGITTLHDLTWKKFTEFHTDDVIKAHERKLEKTIRYQDKIMVDSIQTKNDLLYYYPQIREEKVLVNYPGIDDRFKVITDQNKIKNTLAKYNISYPKRYLLYVGAIEPRKNLETAITTYAQLIKRKKYADFEFLIVGRAGWKNENIFSLVMNLKLEKKVKFIGFVNDDDLPYFYNGAKACIYLSLYEGFGLPPLEAARCLLPSLIYSNSSLKETMPKAYPFTEKGEELSTLLDIIEGRVKINKMDFERLNWKHYCNRFLEFVGAH